MTHRSIIAATLLVAGFGGAALAAANVSDPAEIKALDSATVTAAEAIASVESSSGGKVVELVLQDPNGKPVYQVSVSNSDGTELSFLVDGRSGRVQAGADTQDTAPGSGTNDKTETGEGAGDADSGTEDAN